MNLVNAHKIAKSYAHRTLFENLSVGIAEKERIGFVGPNGAGKSTLLKILAGELQPDAGTVAVKKGMRAGFVHQTPLFAPGATVLSALLEKCAQPDESLPRALELMARLNLNTEFGPDHEVDKLSGGWKKRLAIGRELAIEPELLFLDEPTNHLDLGSILWLEEFLCSAPFSVMMVTHDRLFLQRVANRILDLDPRNPNFLLDIPGGYTQYLETKELELAAQQRHEQVERNRLRRETEWLHRGSIARQTKQSARIQAAGELKDTVADLKNKNQLRKVDLNFGENEHSPQKLIEGTALTKSYGPRALFENLDLLITPKTRLGLLGDNGCGKSTLIKILLGQERADSGQVQRADRAEIAYFEQSRETLDPELSVLKNICPEGDYVSLQGQTLHVRSYLDRFFFSGHKVDLPAGKLSGGEQARLRLAQLMLKPSQILVLDEPTNDLDSEMLDSLETSLKEFNGAVILVTHDRYFMDAVCNQILAFGEGTKLERFANYFQWENWFRDQQKESKTTPVALEIVPPVKKNRLSYKDKFELENMEATILKLEGDLLTLQRESEEPGVLSDHKRLNDVHNRMAALQSEIDARYERWSELEAVMQKK